ncbi:alpha/beta hydrolase [Chitinophaga nivalis]|uniref:Alpha/beta hydrolase n=1 Tax=Chitinophaga nivalis TaxID=2991709 RepID=A0ABT3IKH3_9BACT|nr:alpha/beta hydrolase [Chitinophaga nivalis]MCW3465865.1 alpha/beta hydrolase [Chitinophaga nivalis]MCW3484444.1 alpha/beta hydrolase [Chitinophaga nivalis]
MNARIDRRVLLIIALILSFHLTYGQNQVIPLYEGMIPNARKTPADYIEETDDDGLITRVTVPALTCYLPEKEKANGTAVIICPGGGYQVLSTADEAAVARELVQAGITAFVLKYRLPDNRIMVRKSIGPLQDVQAALMLLHRRAAAWGIDTGKIGLVGLSAGGHVASTAGVSFQQPVIPNPDHINLRPAFMVLLYPVIIFDRMIPSGTRERLVGKEASVALLNQFSNEKRVTAQTPPSFLVHATDDEVVPVKNSVAFFNALQQAKVKSEMHIFQAGGHGFGLYDPVYKNKWLDACLNWLSINHFLNEPVKH